MVSPTLLLLRLTLALAVPPFCRAPPIFKRVLRQRARRAGWSRQRDTVCTQYLSRDTMLSRYLATKEAWGGIPKHHVRGDGDGDAANAGHLV
jgi:hypothetical protein